MDIREKLVELLAPTSLNFEKAVYLADYLVKNGVTVQERLVEKQVVVKKNMEVFVAHLVMLFWAHPRITAGSVVRK